MIRCRECSKCDTIPLTHKTLYYCFLQRMKAKHGIWECKFWEEKPKGHPRWCPKYKEAKR